MHRFSFYILLFITLVVSSCRSDRPEEVTPVSDITIQSGKGVFILNEGNFNWKNASVDYYKFETGELSSDLFKGINKRDLGDVFQSMNVHNGKGYLVINNSGTVEVINPSTIQSLGTITGMKSPRYFIGVNASKAYVSDYKSNAVSVLDLSAGVKIKDISCPGWTEEMVLVDNKVFVTNLYRDYVYIINTDNDKLEDSIKVGYGSGSLVLDKNLKLWVLSGGNSSQNKKPALTRINPATNQVELSLEFTNPQDSPFKLTINGSKDILYYLNNGVSKFAITDIQFTSTPVVDANSKLFYGLGVDPLSGHIYVADAIDYVQRGRIYRYSSSGTLLSHIDVGLIPNGFYFY